MPIHIIAAEIIDSGTPWYVYPLGIPVVLILFFLLSNIVEKQQAEQEQRAYSYPSEWENYLGRYISPQGLRTLYVTLHQGHLFLVEHTTALCRLDPIEQHSFRCVFPPPTQQQHVFASFYPLKRKRGWRLHWNGDDYTLRR